MCFWLEAGDDFAVVKLGDVPVERQVRQAVRVVGEEHVLAFHVEARTAGAGELEGFRPEVSQPAGRVKPVQ